MDWELSIEAFGRRFDTDEACARKLYRIKWPEGYLCPVCRHREASVIRTRRLPLYECKRCHHQTSLTVGTVMEKSKTPLTN
jgi:transcription elongation factor Elf1